MAAAREQALLIRSPFKTGFYAGLGFCFASILFSAIGVIFVVLFGLGTALAAMAHHATTSETVAPTTMHHTSVSASK